MQFETFDQLYAFRPYCLCGAQLDFGFACKVHEDEYTTVVPWTANALDCETPTFGFGFNIDSRAKPYGEVHFDVYSKTNSPHFETYSQYVGANDNQEDAEQFVRKHFNSHVQASLDMKVRIGCAIERSMASERFATCNCNYEGVFGPITFDLDKKVISNFSAVSEEYSILHDNFIYSVSVDFVKDITRVKARKITDTRTHPIVEEIIKLPSEKFSKYPWDTEFLLNKIKTLFLFS